MRNSRLRVLFRHRALHARTGAMVATADGTMGAGWIARRSSGSRPAGEEASREVYSPPRAPAGASGVLGVALPSAAATAAVGPAKLKHWVELGLTWGTRIRTGAGCKNPDSMSGIDAAGISTGIVGRASLRLMAAPPTFVRSSSCVWSKNPVRRFRSRATGIAPSFACVFTLSALLIV